MWSIFLKVFGIGAFFWTIKVLELILDYSTTTKKPFFFASLFMTTFIVIYLVGRRWKHIFVYLLPMQILFIQIATLVVLRPEESQADKWNFEKHILLMRESIVLLVSNFMFISFFSPSFLFTLSTYSPIYLGCTLIQIYSRYGMTKFTSNISLTIPMFLTGIFFSYMFQVRDLMRFF